MKGNIFLLLIFPSDHEKLNTMPSQLLKMESTWLWKLAGIVTLLRPVQPENASGSISVTLAGITMEVSEVQFAKAYAPID